MAPRRSNVKTIRDRLELFRTLWGKIVEPYDPSLPQDEVRARQTAGKKLQELFIAEFVPLAKDMASFFGKPIESDSAAIGPPQWCQVVQDVAMPVAATGGVIKNFVCVLHQGNQPSFRKPNLLSDHFRAADMAEAGRNVIAWATWASDPRAHGQSPVTFPGELINWLMNLVISDVPRSLSLRGQRQWIELFVPAALEEALSTVVPNDSNDSSDPPVLAKAQYQLIQHMDDNEITSAVNRKKREAICSELFEATVDPDHFQKHFAELKKRGFIETRRGPDGGCWLTEEGIRTATEINQAPQTIRTH